MNLQRRQVSPQSRSPPLETKSISELLFFRTFFNKKEDPFARETPLLSLNSPLSVLPRSLFPRLPPPVKRIVLMVGSFIVIRKRTKTALIGRPWTLTNDDVNVRLATIPIKLRQASVSYSRQTALIHTMFLSIFHFFDKFFTNERTKGWSRHRLFLFRS